MKFESVYRLYESKIQSFPSTEIETGKVEWRTKDGVLHREDGPAVILDGTKRWYYLGKRHRVGGPAIEYGDGTKAWYQDGKIHRGDGPAIEYPDGSVQWFFHGRLYDENSPEVKAVKQRLAMKNTHPETTDTFNDLIESTGTVPTMDEIYETIDDLYTQAKNETAELLGHYLDRDDNSEWWLEANKRLKKKIMDYYHIDDRHIQEIFDDYMYQSPSTSKDLFPNLLRILQQRAALNKTAPVTQDTFRDLLDT